MLQQQLLRQQLAQEHAAGGAAGTASGSAPATLSAAAAAVSQATAGGQGAVAPSKGTISQGAVTHAGTREQQDQPQLLVSTHLAATAPGEQQQQQQPWAVRTQGSQSVRATTVAQGDAVQHDTVQQAQSTQQSNASGGGAAGQEQSQHMGSAASVRFPAQDDSTPGPIAYVAGVYPPCWVVMGTEPPMFQVQCC